MRHKNPEIMQEIIAYADRCVLKNHRSSQPLGDLGECAAEAYRRL